MSYQRVKKNFQDGLWNIQMLKVAYVKGIITKEQYIEIKQLTQKGQ